MKKILVTGAAGFIGFHFAKALCEAGHEVLGLDNLNDYYDVALKKARLARLKPLKNFTFERLDLADRAGMAAFFKTHKPEIVAHLAAQAGVRYSLDNPQAYIDSNLAGFGNILEGGRQNGAQHLIFASSSSVYGANTKVPFSETHNVDHPVSLYAATKKAGELMAHSYAHLYGLPCTGLRFFTVYGPWGRPDMAYFKFVKALYEDTPIDVYNHGEMMRDFTYIDDVTGAMMKLLGRPARPDPAWSPDDPRPDTSNAPYRIYNLGNNRPEKLVDMIALLEEMTGRKARKNMMDMQPGDVPATYADIDSLTEAIDFRPSTPLKEGLQKFVAWYKDFYSV